MLLGEHEVFSALYSSRRLARCARQDVLVLVKMRSVLVKRCSSRRLAATVCTTWFSSVLAAVNQGGVDVLANLALSQQQGFPAAGSSVSGSRSRISLAVSLAVALSPQLLVRHC